MRPGSGVPDGPPTVYPDIVSNAMRCPRCGDITDYSDRFCSSCGQDLATYRILWPQAPTTTQTPSPADPTIPRAAGLQQTGPVQPAPVQAEPLAEAPRVPTYLSWAVALLTLCWPAFWAGIPAVVHAGRAESRLAAGDMESARESSQRARVWCWVTFWAGIVLWAVILTLLVTL